MFAAQAHCVPKLVGRQACGGERENFVNALIKVRHPIKTNLHHHPLSPPSLPPILLSADCGKVI